MKKFYLPIIVLLGIAILFATLVNKPLGVGMGTDTTPTENETPIDRSAMTRYTVSGAASRNAICNDGSDAIFYHRPAADGYEDKWVIWFEGGSGCTSLESCRDRWQTDRNLMTSDGAPEKIRPNGILSTNEHKNPDFALWNHVVLNYCSSDIWTGDTAWEDNGKTWHMQGNAIVRATFEDLRSRALFDDKSIVRAQEILVAGTSAGGSGAAQHMNEIASWVPNASVRGVIDSSWDVEVDLPNLSIDEQREQMDAAIAFRGSVLEPACLRAHSESPSACQSVANLFPYLDVPVFVYIDQFDRLKLTERFERGEIPTADRKAFREAYGALVRTSLDGVSGVFSPQATFHGVINNEHFNDVLIDGVSFQEVLGRWYFERDGSYVVIEGADVIE